MVSESFRVYPSEYLVMLSGYYRITHNMLFHARAVILGMSKCVGESTSTKDENIS